MRCLYYWLFLGLFSLVSPVTLAQQSTRWSGYADVNTYASTSNRTPFWLRTNQWGVVPIDAPAASLRLGVHRAYKLTDSLHRRRIDWGFGIETVGNLNRDATRYKRSQFQLPAAYVKIRFGRVELWAGRRQQITGLVDTLLSSGSYAVSGNALPIPQIQLVLPDFVPLHFLKDVVAIKGSYTHGGFNVPYIQDVRLHQKFVYIRIGRPSAKLHVLAGLNHQVQWGGHADYLKNSPVAVDGQLTTNFGDYLKSVVLGIIPKDLDNVRYTSFDAANRIGNHLGSIDIGLTLIRPASSWFICHQHPFEDASGLSWRNVPDGLYGIRWLNRAVSGSTNRFWTWNRIVVEVLSTKNQSGPYFSAPGQNFKGADNYYNHSQYLEGWSYYGQTIGTPFIVPRPDLASTSEQGEFYFPNNRTVVGYTAFDALLGKRIMVQGRFSYSRNFGTYSTPFLAVENQFSGLLTANFPFSGFGHSSFSIAVGADKGQLLTKTAGMQIGLHRRW